MQQLTSAYIGSITIKYTCTCNSDIVGSGDRVICAFCRKVLHTWGPEDIPMIEHKKFSPECPFLNGTYYKSFIYWSDEVCAKQLFFPIWITIVMILYIRASILFQKLFWPTVRKSCSKNSRPSAISKVFLDH